MEARLLAVFLVDAGKVVSADRAIDSLWGDSPPSNPEGALQTQISRLRAALGSSEVIANRSPGYLLRLEPDQLDAAVFERLLAEARMAHGEGLLISALARLGAAETLWRGPAFADFAFEDFARAEASRLELLRMTASTLRIDCAIETGASEEVLPELAALSAQNPFDERFGRQHALALYRTGRQVDALRTLDRLGKSLLEELGASPSAQTEELYDQMLRHDPVLEEAQHRSTPTRDEGMGLVVIETEPEPEYRQLIEERAGTVDGKICSPFEGVIAVLLDDVPQAVSFGLDTFERLVDRGSRPTMAIGAGTFEVASDRIEGLELHRAVRQVGAHAPGQIVVSEAAATLGLGVLPEGWSQSAESELLLPGVTKSENVSYLRRTGVASNHLSRSGRARLTNLPVQLTSFVGRAGELGTLNRLIDEHRLVTVTGPGGIGKTRLCLQIASDRVGAFADGVWLMELADLGSADLLDGAFLRAIRVAETANRDSRETIKDWLEDKQLLLVVDDCERLVDAVAHLVSDLLRSAPGVRVLATSREALGIPGENVWTAPLLIPPEEGSLDLVRIQGNEVAQLFIDRAQTADPQFTLDIESAPSVVRICRAVDGIPLAVELAAAQIRRSSLDEVAVMVETNLHQLESPYRVVADRQRTLAATVDWSYGLLDADARIVFQQLSVFAGPLDAVPVGDVCQVDESTARKVLDQFVGQSLLTQSMGTCRMLQPVRSRAAELLRVEGASKDTFERHGLHFLNEASEADAALRTADQGAWLKRLRFHLSDIRNAIQWGFDHQPRLAARAIVGIADYLFLNQSMTEALELLEKARHMDDLEESLKNRVDLKIARTVNLNDPAASVVLLEDLLTRNLDVNERLAARVLLTFAHDDLGNLDAADAVRVSPEEADQAGDPWLSVEARTRAAIHAEVSGDLEGCARFDADAYDLAVEFQMPWQISHAANNVAGDLATMQGRTDDALRVIEVAISAASESDSPYLLAWATQTKALIRFISGEREEALTLMLEAAYAGLQAGLPERLRLIQLEALSHFLADRGALDEAAQVHGAAHPKGAERPYFSSAHS
jgi:predicted ATPase/DNA-binding SARP family transcriptional activator